MDLTERRAAAHANKFPQGCGSSWHTMCADCCERLGGATLGPTFTFRRLGDVFGQCGNADEIGAFDSSGRLVAAGPTRDAAYSAALTVVR